MTKEQIRKAAKDVADKVCNATDCIEWENLVFAFEDGANWRINSVWHKPEEVPAPYANLLVKCLGGYKMWALWPNHIRDWESLVEKNGVIQWAYIDDLIPTEDETA